MNITYDKLARKLRKRQQDRSKYSFSSPDVHRAAEEELAIAEEFFGITFPEDYRKFQLEFGLCL